jgi:hypothetical protein
VKFHVQSELVRGGELLALGDSCVLVCGGIEKGRAAVFPREEFDLQWIRIALVLEGIYRSNKKL